MDNTLDLTAPPAPGVAPAPLESARDGGSDPLFGLSPEDFPNIDELVIEDGKPVETIFAEKLQRLLTSVLYCSWPGPGEGRPYLVTANVGLFFAKGEPPLVPDVMLCLDVSPSADLEKKENRSYFTWLRGRVPTVAIELVSDRRGGEDSNKLLDYARIGVPYYVIFDPQEHLKAGVLRAFALREGRYEAVEASWLPGACLRLKLWEGNYEGQPGNWLRWCGREGALIPTGHERAEQERERAERAQERADRLAEQLRALGVDPKA